MTNPVLPKGEMLRKAVKWISEERQEHSGKSMSDLIDEAGRRFNLTPKDQSMLVNFLVDHPIDEIERDE